MTNKPKVGIKKTFINYQLPESFMFTCVRILFLVSLLFVALLDPFDPYSPFKFLLFINLVGSLFIAHKDYNNHSGAHSRYTNYTGAYISLLTTACVAKQL